MLGPRQMALVAALRSGKYEQAKGTLRIDNKFCCLGVACDISHLADWTNSYETGVQRYAFAQVLLPPNVMEYFAFKTHDGSYGSEPSACLSTANDEGLKFPEIADLIEREADNLFTEVK